VLAAILVCAGLIGAGMWRVLAVRNNQPPPNNSGAELKAYHREQLLRGVGTRVSFADARDTAEKVKTSIESADRFIYERSDLKMSELTVNRLALAEREVLKGRGRRISLDDLANTLTSALSKCMVNQTDAQIEQMANSFQPTERGEITLRANGKWGFLTKDSFISQAKALREWGQRDDTSLRVAIRPMVDEEVRGLVASLSEALPEQFGGVARDGATPMQAIIIAYAVAADDQLEGMQSDLMTQVVQKRMAARTERPDTGLRHDSKKAYGLGGFLNSSPAHLLINQEVVAVLIDHADGRGK
jgi:hypothetical protein